MRVRRRLRSRIVANHLTQQRLGGGYIVEPTGDDATDVERGGRRERRAQFEPLPRPIELAQPVVGGLCVQARESHPEERREHSSMMRTRHHTLLWIIASWPKKVDPLTAPAAALVAVRRLIDSLQLEVQ